MIKVGKPERQVVHVRIGGTKLEGDRAGDKETKKLSKM